MNTTRTLRLGLANGIAVAATLALSACDPGTSPSSSGAAPVATVTVTVTASPTAPAAGPDFGFTFFEEAQLGSTWDQMSDELNMPVVGITECPWYGAVWNTEIATTYAFTSSMDPTSGVTFFYTNRFLAPDAAAFPRNAEGVGVGSTQAEVLAAYPGAVVDTYNDLGAGDLTRITVDDPDSDAKYVFAISAGSSVVDLLQWGDGTAAGNQWSHLCTGF